MTLLPPGAIRLVPELVVVRTTVTILNFPYSVQKGVVSNRIDRPRCHPEDSMLTYIILQKLDSIGIALTTIPATIYLHIQIAQYCFLG